MIYGDTFKSLYTLPWHLTTREAAQKSFDLLNEGGCTVVNIISSLKGDASLFLQAELLTYQDVFPYVYIFAVMDPDDLTGIQSTIMVAVKSDREPVMENDDPEINGYLSREVSSLVEKNLPVLTDDYAPVDFYTNKAIR